MFKKVISFVLSVIFSLQTCGLAQAGQLNLAGYLGQGGGVSALDRFRPAHLRYFSYEPDSDNFRILLDKADEKGLSDIQVKDKADELMKYFRIGLSLPNDKFWVNLRPDAPEQIIDPALEQTDMGKIMLEADLQLKKDTSSLTSPQTKEGKEYWDKLYKKAGELFGTENITIPTITRPWIVPGEIIVRESGNSGSIPLTTGAYIYKAALKVMLEEDYLRGMKDERRGTTIDYNFPDPRMKELNKYSTQLIRELIIPQLTKEVNRAKRYAGLRQVYYSLILARWFKQSYQNFGASEHQGIRAPVNENNALIKLIDSGNLSNLTSQEPWSKDTYYQGYKKSFEQGEYNLSETVRTPTGQVIRRYVSGGVFGLAAGATGGHKNVVGSSIVSPANSKLLKYTSGGKTVAIAAASPLVPNTEIPKRLEGWPIFESIEKLFRNQSQGVTYFIPTNILIGKTVCTTIQVIMDWVEVDEDGENIIKYWIVEFKENAKSKEPVARIKVYSNDIFSAETPKNLSDTEINLIVTKMLSKPLFLDKTQMEELEKKGAIQRRDIPNSIEQTSSALDGQTTASAANSEQIKDDLLITAIGNISNKFSELTVMSDISLSASARMKAKDAGNSLTIIYSDKASVLMLEDICNRISEYKGNNSWRIEFGKGSAFEQIKNRLLEEAGITTSSALNSENKESKRLIIAIEYVAKKLSELTPISGIIFYASGGMTGLGTPALYYNDDHFRSEFKKINKSISEYKKPAFWSIELKQGSTFEQIKNRLLEEAGITSSSELTLEEAKNRALGLKNDFLGVLEENAGYPLWKNYQISKLFVSLIETELEGLGGFIGLLKEWYVELEKSYDGRKKNVNNPDQLALINERWDNVSKAYNKMLKGFQEIQDELMRGASSALATKGAVPEDIGAVDFRAMDMLIQPAGSFRGLDFSPARLSSSALEAMDLDKSLEGIKQMVSGSMRPAPQRLKEYISACIFKGKIDEKADDFILSMLDVFQLQAEEGIESAALEREAVVLADTRRYVLPEKRLAASNGYGLN